MEYFVVRNYGYDGIGVSKFSDKVAAEIDYQEQLADIEKEIKTYGEEKTDKGVALIEGTILKSQDADYLGLGW